MCFERPTIRLKAECSVVRVSIETVALAVNLQDVDVVSADGPAACLSEPKTPVHWLMGRLVVIRMELPSQHWLKISKGRSAQVRDR